MLLVDDNAFNLFSLGLMLKESGILFDEAYNGADALKLIQEKAPCDSCGNKTYALVLTDLEIPLMDGYELMRRVAEMPERPTVVAVTGHDSPTVQAKVRESGGDDVLTKPIDKAKLLPLLG